MSEFEGKKAPAFTLDGSDGKTHKLSDYKGRTVILYFYPRDNTPGCTKESCGFRDLNKQLSKLDAVVLGVSPDGLESHDKFIADFSLPFVLLSDPDKKVMESYGAWGKKVMYGKETIGVIRTTTIIGPDGKMLKRWLKVPKAESHPQKVLEYLESL